MDDFDERRRRRRSAERLTVWLVIGGLVGVLVLVLCIAGAWLALRPAGEGPPNPFVGIGGAPSQPVPEYDDAAYKEIAEAWQANEVVAAKKYLGRRYTFRGRIYGIGAPDRVLVDTGRRLDRISVRMSGREVEKVKEGETRTFEATLEEFAPFDSVTPKYGEAKFTGGVLR